MRCFVGMHSSAAAISGTVNPSTLFNLVGIGFDSTDLNWQIMYNDGSGVATKIDTLLAYLLHPVIELRVYCAPNSNSISVYLLSLNLNVSYSATLSSNLPGSVTLLASHIHVATTLALSVGVDVSSQYLESEY